MGQATDWRNISLQTRYPYEQTNAVFLHVQGMRRESVEVCKHRSCRTVRLAEQHLLICADEVSVWSS